MTSNEIKDLKEALKKKNQEVQAASIELSAASVKSAQLRRQLSDLERLLDFKAKEITVTDHAFVRYLERVLDLDIIELKRKLLSDELKSMIETGADKVTKDGITYVIRDKTIVTITD